MKYEKTYCSNNDCPFKECDKHVCNCETDWCWVANFYSTCEKYIVHLLKECGQGDE